MNKELPPEEIVRQKLLDQMTSELEYPAHFLTTEKGLSNLPSCFLETSYSSRRRVDIICYAKDIHSEYELYPLLLIECKAVKLDEKALRQVEGYNYYTRAFFWAVANAHELHLFWLDQKTETTKSINFLPSFPKLRQTAFYANQSKS